MIACLGHVRAVRGLGAVVVASALRNICRAILRVAGVAVKAADGLAAVICVEYLWRPLQADLVASDVMDSIVEAGSLVICTPTTSL